MASLTLKNLPDKLLERLRERAESDRRSLSQEAIYLLERALSAPDAATEARFQDEVWSRLAGQWRDDRTPRQEIADIYAARTTGRSVEALDLGAADSDSTR